MKAFNDIQNIYFLGIGGIGMSALAQYFALNGKRVAGYDKTPGRMTRKLAAAGIPITFEDQVDCIPRAIKNQHTLVVYTPAIPEDLKLLKFFKNAGYPLKKRSLVLAEVARQMPCLAIAGTHGKTTSSAMLAHLLKATGHKITAFLGGVCENYQSNFIGDGHEACVVEADEYDRSFLALSPQYAAITSMEADHLDIYGKAEELTHSFHEFAQKLPSPDTLFYQQGLAMKGGSTVAVDQHADYSVQNISIKNGTYQFDFKTPQRLITNLQLSLPGRHNLLNAGIALAMALKFGANPEKLAEALKVFKGVERRFTYHLKTEDLVLIEDYAHHPTELKAACQAAREMHPDKKITAVFQPHLYSRTRDFAQEFADSLSGFDEIVLLPIYPAREKPIPGIDSTYLLGLIDNPHKKLVEKEALSEAIIKSDNEVVMLLGAGDIGNEVEPLMQHLSREK